MTGAEDAAFICRAVGDLKVIGSLPFSEKIRASDQNGRSTLDDAEDSVVDSLQMILAHLRQERRP